MDEAEKNRILNTEKGRLLLAHHDAVLRRNWAEELVRRRGDALAKLSAAVLSYDAASVRDTLLSEATWLTGLDEALVELTAARAAAIAAYDECSKCGVTPRL